MKKMKIPCISGNKKEKYAREISMIMKTDYDIDAEYKIAEYSPDNVKKEYLDIFVQKPAAQA